MLRSSLKCAPSKAARGWLNRSLMAGKATAAYRPHFRYRRLSSRTIAAGCWNMDRTTPDAAIIAPHIMANRKPSSKLAIRKDSNTPEMATPSDIPRYLISPTMAEATPRDDRGAAPSMALLFGETKSPAAMPHRIKSVAIQITLLVPVK